MKKCSVMLIGLLVGCELGQIAEAEKQDHHASEMNATAVNNGKPESCYPQVLRLLSEKGACSAVLVAPNKLLTASHCLDPFRGEALKEAELLAVDQGMNFAVAASSFVQHPNNSPECERPVSGNDLAIMTLEKPILSIPPVTLGMGMLKDAIKTVGFGIYSPSNRSSEKRSFETEIGAIGPAPEDTLLASFPKEGLSSCRGDSGGGVFKSDSSCEKPVLVGVIQGSAGQCSSTNLSVNLTAPSNLAFLQAALYGGTLPERTAECCPGVERACQSAAKGSCAAGKQICNYSTGKWDPCRASTPQEEVCGNGIDENCDGTVDNGCSLSTGQGNGSGAAGLQEQYRCDMKALKERCDTLSSGNKTCEPSELQCDCACVSF